MWQCALTRAGQERLAGQAHDVRRVALGRRRGPMSAIRAVGDGDRAPALEAPVDQDEVGGQAHHLESVGGTERPVTGA